MDLGLIYYYHVLHTRTYLTEYEYAGGICTISVLHFFYKNCFYFLDLSFYGRTVRYQQASRHK